MGPYGPIRGVLRLTTAESLVGWILLNTRRERSRVSGVKAVLLEVQVTGSSILLTFFHLADGSADDAEAIYAISCIFVTTSGFAKLLPVRKRSHQIDL